MTAPGVLARDDTQFRRSVAASGILHLAVILLAGFGYQGSLFPRRTVLEIDLSIPLGSGGHKAGPIHDEPAMPLAPKKSPVEKTPPKAKPTAAPKVAPVKDIPKPKPEPIIPLMPAEKPDIKAPKLEIAQPVSVPKDAVETPGAEAPGSPDGALRGTGTAPLSGGGRGYGEGTGDGFGTGQPFDLLPKLLNRVEIHKNIRRFYPESERRARREGSVVLLLEITEDGKAVAVEVRQSAGSAFDRAAKKVVPTMRWRAAMQRGRAVPVRVPMRFEFKLE